MFRESLPVALIDFDAARPGLRLWDLGYSAFTWLDLGNPDHDGAKQVARLGAFANAYGRDGCTAETVAAFALARQTALAVSAERRGHAELARWAQDCATWTAEHVITRLLPTGDRDRPTA